MEVKKAFQFLVYGIILIVLIGTLIGLSTKARDNLIGLFISAGISLIFSAIVGVIIDSFSDDKLKEIFWIVKIEILGHNLDIPISLFTIATILIKLWWFG